MKIRSILIVDDNEGDQFLAEHAIKEFDASIAVSHAYDGAEALDLLNNSVSKPDLIVLDINMPGMNGIEFLDAYCRPNDDAAVVVMLSSSDQEKDIKACNAYNCVKDYFTKPLSIEYLKKLTGN